ncbi:dihydropteroate synthase [bacterium BMS3Abin02]|nr:dihydropteroate synthase [bacterium BMS3Abin02]GBE22598.1 dihydropteroate synthase [bacterium BMS3Bbin01]
MTWRARGVSLPDRALIMGIVNVTPDSFSDGGRFLDPDEAIALSVRLVADGADIIDVGGESTRPGAEPVPAAEEIRRVEPVVGALVGEGIVVSIDTAKRDVAQAALEAGASIVNDVSALGAAGMAETVAASDAGLVLMHMQGTPRTMQTNPTYGDVVTEVRDFLVDRALFAQDHGISPDCIAIDPGIGFGKTIVHNLTLLAHIGVLVETGYPVLIGTSRKSFLGALTGEERPERRDVATAAASALAVAAGASVVRVHNVAVSRPAVQVADAMVRHGGGAS